MPLLTVSLLMVEIFVPPAEKELCGLSSNLERNCSTKKAKAIRTGTSLCSKNCLGKGERQTWMIRSAWSGTAHSLSVTALQ